jgi:hypothetical protein
MGFVRKALQHSSELPTMYIESQAGLESSDANPQCKKGIPNGRHFRKNTGHMGARLMRAQELDVGLQLAVAAVLAVGHQVNGAVALLLHWKHVALVFVCPPSGHPANYLHKTVLTH